MTLSALARLGVFGAIACMATTPAVGRARADNHHVQFTATVSDSKSVYLTDLTARDFRVFEEGVEQTVTSVSRASEAVPIAFSLMLDASNSLESDFPKMKSVAVDFAKRLRPSDVAEVIGFNTDVARPQTFTTDVVQLERAIGGIQQRGSTAFNNALYITLRELQKIAVINRSQTRRYVVIVLSDGQDTSSLVALQELLGLVRRTEAIIYAVSPYSRTWRPGLAALRQLAEATGGRQFVPSRPQHFAKICDQVWTDLASQYVIRYDSSNPRRDGEWRHVEVRVKVPKVTVRAKSGYFAPGS
jgi:Ca-activated chloride channel homolog